MTGAVGHVDIEHLFARVRVQVNWKFLGEIGAFEFDFRVAVLRCGFQFAVPFAVEPIQEFDDEFVARVRDPFRWKRVHAVLEEQQFFVEMVDGGVVFGVQRAAHVFFLRHIDLGLEARVVEDAVLGGTVCDGADDADRAEAIEPVGVLDDLSFERGHGVFSARAFKRHVPDDVADVGDPRGVRVLFFEPFFRFARTGGDVAVLFFPVGDVVQ